MSSAWAKAGVGSDRSCRRFRVKPGRLAFLAASLLLGANATSGCGSDGDGDGAGAGGAGGRACVPGETQGCLCAGQVAGAQVCAGDGMSWGRCECGAGAGGGGGADGGAGTAASGGTSAAAGAPAASGGSAGMFLDASADGPPAEPQEPGPLDDPCPDPTLYPYGIDLNCSDQCVASDQGLDECAACRRFVPPALRIDSAFDLPFIVRLPANPGMLCECGSSGARQYSFWFDIGPIGVPVIVLVGAPWYVHYGGTTAGATCAASPPWYKGCYWTGATGGARIEVATDDPNAPSRNLVIRRAVNAESCTASKFWE
jgi:hypothetical protein